MRNDEQFAKVNYRPDPNGTTLLAAIEYGIPGMVLRGSVDGLAEKDGLRYLIIRDDISGKVKAIDGLWFDGGLIDARVEARGVTGINGRILWHLDELHETPLSEPMWATEVVKEYRQKILPELENAKREAFSKRQELGLYEIKTPGGETFMYPQPLTERDAYVKAMDEVGGEVYKRARKEVARLDYLDGQAAQAISRFEVKLRMTPHTEQCSKAVRAERGRLHDHAYRTREEFDRAYLEFERVLGTLRSEPKAGRVKALGAIYLAEDRVLEARRPLADREYQIACAELKAAQMMQREFRTLEKKVVEVERTLRGVPVPGDRLAFQHELRLARERQRTVELGQAV